MQKKRKKFKKDCLLTCNCDYVLYTIDRYTKNKVKRKNNEKKDCRVACNGKLLAYSIDS